MSGEILGNILLRSMYIVESFPERRQAWSPSRGLAQADPTQVASRLRCLIRSVFLKVEFDLGVWDRPAIPAILAAKLLPAVIGRIRLWAA